MDISAPDKAAIVKTLLPQEDKKTSFHLLNYFPLKTDTNSPENNILKITSYRFVLNYRLKSESDFKQKPSKSFLVD